MQNPTETFVYLTRGRILMISNALDNDDHSHHALQITLNLEPRPFLINHPGGSNSSECTIIKHNYMHQISVENTWRALLLIEPEATQSLKIIKHYLSDRDLNSPSEDDTAYFRKRLSHFKEGLQPIEEACSVVDDIVDRLAGSTSMPAQIDPRIQTVMNLIHLAQGQDISLEELASQVKLSASRLSHIFSSEAGLPIKRYILWYKLCQTCFKMFAGTTVSQASVEAGFSDASHYNRTCRNMFGMTPTQMIRESHSVKLASDIHQPT